MLVQFEGKEYQFDLEEIDVNQARYIKRHTGMTLLQLEEGLENVDAEAMAALYWLMLAQNGSVVDLQKINFKVVAFGKAISAAQRAEQEAAEANPTEEDELPDPPET